MKIWFEFQCLHCKTTFRFEEGNWISFTCPVCHRFWYQFRFGE